MEKIEYTDEVKIGEKVITSIEVQPLTFIELGKIWDSVIGRGKSASSAIQRERIKRQTVFKAGADTVALDDVSLNQLPVKVAKSIISALDIGQGVSGEVLGNGDGVVTPVLYKLGTPVKMKSSKDGEVIIKELEFTATTYADIEDVLAADHDVNKVLALLKLAKPVGTSLSMLPGWAIDRLTVADGVTMMTEVLPSF